MPSEKKLQKGDGYPDTRKLVLGWIIDIILQTLELPPHRKARLQEIFEYLQHRDRVGLSKWQKILGELHSMALGIPGCHGLFSCLQKELKYVEHDRIRITQPTHDLIDDFEHLSQSLEDRPTFLSEIVPDHPVTVGPHDASGKGMGGVWLPAVTNTHLQPILWRATFPRTVQSRLVSYDNPSGTITNSDLELPGCVAHQDVLLQEVDCAQRTILPATGGQYSFGFMAS